MGQPYVYKNIDYQINDSLLKFYVNSINNKSFIKRSDNFDADVFRKRKNTNHPFLLDNGYHYFNKEFIFLKLILQ